MSLEITGPHSIITYEVSAPVKCPHCSANNPNPFNPPPLFFKDEEARLIVPCSSCAGRIEVIRSVTVEYEVCYR